MHEALRRIADARVRVVGVRDAVVLVGGAVCLGSDVFGEGEVTEAGLAEIVLQRERVSTKAVGRTPDSLRK